MKNKEKNLSVTTGKHRNRSSLLNRMRRRWQLYLFALPAVVYLILFCYKPMVYILMAFQNYKPKLGLWGSEWVGFYQFERFFNSYWFTTVLKNTFTISGLSILITFPLPIILALMVNEVQNNRLRKGFQIVSYAPHFVSMVAVCSIVRLFVADGTGIINIIIEALGGESQRFMMDADAFKWLYILSGAWQGTGWGCIIYYATLSSVDKSLHEAAEIDGANRFQRIIHINLPVLIPTICIMLIMRCGSVLSVGYEKVLLLQNSYNLSQSEVISTYVYRMGLQQTNYSFSTAVGLFNSLVNCVFLLTVNKITKKLSGTGLW